MQKTGKKAHAKRAIIKDIMAKGVTARKAAKALNAVIDSWKYALWCGEEVEVPGGILQAKITKGTEWATVQRFQNIQTKEPMIRMVHTPGRRQVVKLKPDPNLRLRPDPPPLLRKPLLPPTPPPIPETAEEIEERQLVTYLLGLARLADDKTMIMVREAVGAHPREPGRQLSFKPGALRRRLQQFEDRGWRFSYVSELAQQVSEFYWV